MAFQLSPKNSRVYFLSGNFSRCYSKILLVLNSSETPPSCTLGTGYRWSLYDLCRWLFHCQSSKTLPECSGQYQNWIPPLKIQSSFTDLKERKKKKNWSEEFSFQAPWLFSNVFLRLGILELLGSSHNDLGLVGSLCSDSWVMMNSIFLSGPHLLCWPEHLESCCQSGWFNSTGHLDFSQCCSYYFIPACVRWCLSIDNDLHNGYFSSAFF